MRHFLQMPRGGRGSFHTFEAVDYTTGAKKERRDVSQALRDVSKEKGGKRLEALPSATWTVDGRLSWKVRNELMGLL